MRRILRKIAANKLDELGDTSTLADPAVVQVRRGGRALHDARCCAWGLVASVLANPAAAQLYRTCAAEMRCCTRAVLLVLCHTVRELKPPLLTSVGRS